MSTRSPTRTDSHDPPRRHRRWPLLTSLALLLLATLAAAAAALHSVGGRDDSTSFTAADARELVVTSTPAGSSWPPAPTAAST